MAPKRAPKRKLSSASSSGSKQIRPKTSTPKGVGFDNPNYSSSPSLSSVSSGAKSGSIRNYEPLGERLKTLRDRAKIKPPKRLGIKTPPSKAAKKPNKNLYKGQKTGLVAGQNYPTQSPPLNQWEKVPMKALNPETGTRFGDARDPRVSKKLTPPPGGWNMSHPKSPDVDVTGFSGGTPNTAKKEAQFRGQKATDDMARNFERRTSHRPGSSASSNKSVKSTHFNNSPAPSRKSSASSKSSSQLSRTLDDPNLNEFVKGDKPLYKRLLKTQPNHPTPGYTPGKNKGRARQSSGIGLTPGDTPYTPSPNTHVAAKEALQPKQLNYTPQSEIEMKEPVYSRSAKERRSNTSGSQVSSNERTVRKLKREGSGGDLYSGGSKRSKSSASTTDHLPKPSSAPPSSGPTPPGSIKTPNVEPTPKRVSFGDTPKTKTKMEKLREIQNKAKTNYAKLGNNKVGPRTSTPKVTTGAANKSPSLSSLSSKSSVKKTPTATPKTPSLWERTKNMFKRGGNKVGQSKSYDLQMDAVDPKSFKQPLTSQNVSKLPKETLSDKMKRVTPADSNKFSIRGSSHSDTSAAPSSRSKRSSGPMSQRSGESAPISISGSERANRPQLAGERAQEAGEKHKILKRKLDVKTGKKKEAGRIVKRAVNFGRRFIPGKKKNVLKNVGHQSAIGNQSGFVRGGPGRRPINPMASGPSPRRRAGTAALARNAPGRQPTTATAAPNPVLNPSTTTTKKKSKLGKAIKNAGIAGIGVGATTLGAASIYNAVNGDGNATAQAQAQNRNNINVNTPKSGPNYTVNSMPRMINSSSGVQKTAPPPSAAAAVKGGRLMEKHIQDLLHDQRMLG